MGLRCHLQPQPGRAGRGWVGGICAALSGGQSFPVVIPLSSLGSVNPGSVTGPPSRMAAVPEPLLVAPSEDEWFSEVCLSNSSVPCEAPKCLNSVPFFLSLFPSGVPPLQRGRSCQTRGGISAESPPEEQSHALLGWEEPGMTFSGEIGISFSTSSLLVPSPSSCLAGEPEEFGRNIVDAPNPFTFLLLTSVGNGASIKGTRVCHCSPKKGQWHC